ncbi:Putative signal transducing protein [Granulicella rosea]|uniref:Putative signal transducing protein n=1 Tax=Granulicella rosea TaxID=474952 RepID=A0A239CY55_9BACT|nr:DUF2007 domain-containing protein [Granulicella rosea]SNS24591.1 Putative signal transducing protein [Granulicella rosea]
MNPSPEEFAATYASLSEPELLRTAHAYDSLTEPAQAALRAEFARRELEPPFIDAPDEGVDSSALVTIRRYRDHSEAIVARSLLESASIPVYLADENFVRIDWQMSNMVGGIRLQVAQWDEAAALELLDQPSPGPIDFAPGESFPKLHCPVCSSIDIAFRGEYHAVARTSFQLLWPFPILLLPLTLLLQALDRWRNPPNTWSCAQCGARWQDVSAENPPPTSNFGA